MNRYPLQHNALRCSTALAGGLSDWTVLGLAVTIYAGRLAIRAWYIRGHRYGPIEWVLRAATYGTLRPTEIGRTQPG
ncbi:DUF418 domain-containing protein [Nocardia sp. NPDC046473]|uniref:DUF418 domain-containing protein n=1 Tax=Nocardia sp. NPDC046473 TaxID=3155733 RepID=UPI0033D9C116